MYEAKTKPTGASVAGYIAAIPDEERRRECRALAAMMRAATGRPARMWGPSIVGFDRYHYRYASGHEGDCCVVGFSSRGREVVLYLLSGYEPPRVKKLLARLGPHRTGKACLYLRRLADVDLGVLEELIAISVADTRSRFPRSAPRSRPKAAGSA